MRVVNVTYLRDVDGSHIPQDCYAVPCLGYEDIKALVAALGFAIKFDEQAKGNHCPQVSARLQYNSSNVPPTNLRWSGRYFIFKPIP